MLPILDSPQHLLTIEPPLCVSIGDSKAHYGCVLQLVCENHFMLLQHPSAGIDPD